MTDTAPQTRLSKRRSKKYYWTVEVQTKGNERWQPNSLAFASEKEAHSWAQGQQDRWSGWGVKKIKRALGGSTPNEAK